jgi:hypothetical protein
MEKNKHTDDRLNAIIELGLRARSQPMDCNMFEKKCTLLTCHTKHRCLWTKEEAQKEKGVGE